MDSQEEKRRHTRVPYHSPIQFIVLSSENAEFQRIEASGEIVDASSSGIGVLTCFPLVPGHVVEWDDKHQKGKLHIALVKWSMPQEDRYRAGLMII
ncbi:MAG: PilZ domain-containing protein [Nitrospiraceae bacterium]|nr:PilZ domain-containing protein [Nitrospiraceae bacterium]